MRTGLPPTFSSFPRHRRAMERIVAVAADQASVLGILVVGSFAGGAPDEVSDVDVLIVLAPGSFDSVWSARAAYSSRAIRTWDVEGSPGPMGAHKWITGDLVLVECLFAEAGSGVRLAQPFELVGGSAAAIDGLERRAPITRAEVDAGTFVGDSTEWLYDALKRSLRGQPDAARRIVEQFAGSRSTSGRRAPSEGMADGIEFIGIDHVQLTMPAGREEDARRFYREVLGLVETEKPPGLTGRGGCWFISTRGRVHVHLGVDSEFRPASKAHPAFLVTDLDPVRRRLSGAGVHMIDDHSIVGVRRFYAVDPFGNRLEFIAGTDGGFTLPDDERDGSQ